MVRRSCSSFCLCILPPAAATELNVNLTASASMTHRTQTSYRPLCSGGRLSQEAMWQLQGITVNLKRKKKGFIPEECTSLRDCFKNTSSDSLKRRVTLHTSYGCKAIKTWHPNRWWKSYLNWNWHKCTDTLLVVLGANRTGMGLLSLSSCIYL